MSYHDSSHTGVSIFVNRENLALSLPLISLCSIYAFFKFVPLNIGLSIIGLGALAYKITSSLRARAVEKKEQKIASLDEGLLKELAADELKQREKEAQKLAKKQRKNDDKVRLRLKAEKKAGTNQASHDDDDEEDEDVSTFAKKKK